MTLHWLYLCSAVLLLWFPVTIGRAMARHTPDPRRMETVSLFQMTKVWVNWVDLLRAVLGTWMLMQMAIEVMPKDKDAAMSAFLIRGAILGLGLLLQVVRFRRELMILAPVFYLTGVTLSLSGWECGGFAVFVGWTFGLAGKSAQYLLPALVVALGLGGYTLGGLGLPLFLNVAMILLPLVLGLLFLSPPRFLGAGSITD